MESLASTVPVVGPVDRILIHYVHDVMRCPASLDRVVGQLPAGRPPRRDRPALGSLVGSPLSLWVRLIARPYHTTFEGFGRPWSHLATRLRDLDAARSVFGRAYFSYIATGTVR